MPLTTLDPRTALIVIDLQRGFVAAPTVHPFAEVVSRSAELAAAFREHGLPVVLVTVAGTPPGRTEQGPRAAPGTSDGYAELMPELNRQPTDHVLVKHSRSAFSGSDLAAYLRERDVTQVVVTGISTSGGVESTARDAHEQGFNVTLAIDAMTDTRAAGHDHSLTLIFPRIAETGSTEQVLGLLEQARRSR
jgi:nicotinamidase-related amidase